MVSLQDLYEIRLSFVLRFSRLIRTTKVYNPENETIDRHVDECFHLIQTILKNEKRLSLKILMDAIFVNEERVTGSKDTYPRFKLVMEEMKDRAIGEVLFKEGVSRKDLKGFSYLLAGDGGKSGDGGGSLSDQLIKRSIYAITLKPFDPIFADERHRKAQAKKIYFRSIAMVKEVCQNLLDDKPLALRKAKRLTQSMVDLFRHDSFALLGLSTVKNYDEYTYNHSVNVCIYSLALGAKLGLSKKTLAELGLAALFHDVGKVKIPDEILKKPERLDPLEWEIVKSHPMIGVEEIIEFRQFAEVHPRILFGIFDHHLNFNTSGYPSLKRKKRQTLFGKIVTIADVYDALTTPRCYRPGVYSPVDALKLMWKECGVLFDPVLMKVFVNAMGVYPVGCLVQLDDDQLGIVSENHANPKLLDRPKVLAITPEKSPGQTINLSDKDEKTGGFKRTIVRCLDPKKYDIVVQDQFL
ncbi:MAG: HD domain-containing protein [Proteobacteria bacterium]|nr:HD domain-containing protein [Pseudomonadota bacterium]